MVISSGSNTSFYNFTAYSYCKITSHMWVFGGNKMKLKENPTLNKTSPSLVSYICLIKKHTKIHAILNAYN
jgi:hypothetical protein